MIEYFEIDGVIHSIRQMDAITSFEVIGHRAPDLHAFNLIQFESITSV